MVSLRTMQWNDKALLEWRMIHQVNMWRQEREELILTGVLWGPSSERVQRQHGDGCWRSCGGTGVATSSLWATFNLHRCFFSDHNLLTCIDIWTSVQYFKNRDFKWISMSDFSWKLKRIWRLWSSLPTWEQLVRAGSGLPTILSFACWVLSLRPAVSASPYLTLCTSLFCTWAPGQCRLGPA